MTNIKKVQDFSNFKVWCSEIYSLFSIPKGVTFPSKQDMKKYDRFMNSDEDKNEEELEFLKKIDFRIEQYKDPPLSKTSTSALIRQYGWLVYNKKVAPKGDSLSFLKKGTDMEAEAVELLSKIDKQDYSLCLDKIENDYLIGRCDICHAKQDKIIDTKISWNVNSFLKSRTTPLSAKYWYQMQGYMELYNVSKAEVVFLLLNTPPELIEREKIKLLNRFIIGEIDRDKYELDMSNIDSAFTYGNLPIKRRHFRFQLKREPMVFDKVYSKVEKARLWMQDFEQEMGSNIFVIPSDKYFESDKNNIEPDSQESFENYSG